MLFAKLVIIRTAETPTETETETGTETENATEMVSEAAPYLVINDPSGQLPLEGVILLSWGAQVAFARHRGHRRRWVKPFDLLQKRNKHKKGGRGGA